MQWRQPKNVVEATQVFYSGRRSPLAPSTLHWWTGVGNEDRNEQRDKLYM